MDQARFFVVFLVITLMFCTLAFLDKNYGQIEDEEEGEFSSDAPESTGTVFKAPTGSPTQGKPDPEGSRMPLAPPPSFCFEGGGEAEQRERINFSERMNAMVEANNEEAGTTKPEEAPQK